MSTENESNRINISQSLLLSAALRSGGAPVLIGVAAIGCTYMLHKKLTKDLDENDIKENYNTYLSNFNKKSSVKSNSYMDNFKIKK